MTKKREKLTIKQQTFVAEYLKTGNATEAARRAGYKGNDNTLRVVGQENLLKPAIKKLIEEKNQKRNERFQLEEDFELKAAKDIYDNSMKIMDYKSANSAIQTIAKIRGKFIQKIQVGVSDDIAGMLGRIKVK